MNKIGFQNILNQMKCYVHFVTQLDSKDIILSMPLKKMFPRLKGKILEVKNKEKMLMEQVLYLFRLQRKEVLFQSKTDTITLSRIPIIHLTVIRTILSKDYQVL